MTQRPVIVWFRQDLRLADNPAFSACAGAAVVPLFILSQAPDRRPLGAASRWWLEKSLAALEAALAARGLRLILRRGDPSVILPEVAAEAGAGAVAWNRLYGADAARDAALVAALRQGGVAAQTYNASLLIEPWGLRTGGGRPYQVFTPFWRAARAVIDAPEVAASPQAMTAPLQWPRSDLLADWGLHPRTPDWSQGFDIWTPGESGAQARLAQFLDEGLQGYADRRDAPHLDATTRLSPHLHWGEIGPRQVWTAAQSAVHAAQSGERQLDKLQAELGWREFNHHLLFARPDLASRNIRPAFDAMAWRQAPRELEAWKRGLTGYPIVDAGMRQLWATGWMHNRVRLIAGSFLIKDLLIDWREGEQWFWDTLVDADEANNPANWQWVAGSGADAAPFFRIFNPVTQGERFDPQGAYVRRWVPELAAVPGAAVHRPWTLSPIELHATGIVLGETYPAPIVDHAFARLRALAAFKALPRPGQGA